VTRNQWVFVWSEAMKEIPLSQGKVALVDDEDYEWLMQWKWQVRWNGWTHYAMRRDKYTKTTVLMHREILGVRKGFLTDHKNGNGLDNRKKNLRECTSAENNRNRGVARANKYGYKGIFYDPKRKNPYRAQIWVNSKAITLGYFLTIEDAARAYDDAARKHHGEFANLNFPTPTEQGN
jgi:hypothetical protein